MTLGVLLAATLTALSNLNSGLLREPALTAALPAALRTIPAVRAEAPPAPPFVLELKTKAARTAAACLADAIFYEAGSEPLDGQRAVAQVVLNRVRDRNFPKTICGVVYQGWEKKTGCQFSFACDGSLVRRPPRPDEFAEAMKVARQALGGYVMAAVGTATHYHTEGMKPWWAPTVVEVAQVGSQIFYRWPGHAGEPAALADGRYAGPGVRVSSVDYRRERDGPRVRKAGRDHRISGVIRLAGDGDRG